MIRVRIIIDRINATGNAIASVRLSFRPFVSTLSSELRLRLTVDLELLRVSRS